MGDLRRVVVTGFGLVSSLGLGAQQVWANILNGQSGVFSLIGTNFEKLPSKVAGKIPGEILDLEKEFSEAERRSSSRATLLSLLASNEAIKISGLSKLSQEERERVGVLIGVGMVDLQDVSEVGRILEEKGYSKVTPYFIPRILQNLASGQISIKHGFYGPNHCVTTACASGAHAIGDSYNLIKFNYADAMVCGGSEAPINPISIAGFSRLRALSTKFNSSPEKASRPFDSARDGFVIGEGAGTFILEELNFALKRGAHIYGEVLGYGLTGDGHHMTAAREDGNGAFRSMQQALNVAHLTPSDLSYINCHATSTPIGDRAEIRAIKKLYGSNEPKVAISSTKGYHGHLLGAAGAVESILTLITCQKKIPLNNVNVDNLEDEFKSMNIIRENHSLDFSNTKKFIAMKNSFGFGGTNASLIFSNFIP